jgi:hypothetical protein
MSYSDRWLAPCCRSWEEADSYDKGSTAAFIRTTTLGKSFSSATTLVRRDVPLQTHEATPGPSPAGIEYTSINQFQQRVELYRGRCTISL